MRVSRIESRCIVSVFLFNDTATTEIYTLSLHDALPILVGWIPLLMIFVGIDEALKVSAISLAVVVPVTVNALDWKSTSLKSSHANISYGVFRLEKKKALLTYPSPP